VAKLFPESTVIGVEGAVGIGNGSLGTQSPDWHALCSTKAAQTHLRWTQKLGLENCLLAPEVWDYPHVLALAKKGVRVDVMLSLSVWHHVDDYSNESIAYPDELRGDRVQATLQLLRRALDLAHVHIIELPDKPWMGHLHEAFKNDARAILEAACECTGDSWQLRKIYASDKWIGHRDVFLMYRIGAGAPDGGVPSPVDDVKELFPVLLPRVGDPAAELALAAAVAAAPSPQYKIRRGSGGANVKKEDVNNPVPISGNSEFVSQVLLGEWMNARGQMVSVRKDKKRSDRCFAQYQGKGEDEEFPLTWTVEESGGSWGLRNNLGNFVLEAASSTQLHWSSQKGWETVWRRPKEDP